MKLAKYDWVTKGRHRNMFRKETTEEGRKKMVILKLTIKKTVNKIGINPQESLLSHFKRMTSRQSEKFVQ